MERVIDGLAWRFLLDIVRRTTMDPTNYRHDARIGGQSRRTILRTLAATGSVAAFGGMAAAQEDDGAAEETESPVDPDEVPVAGDFPEGETVGLQPVAAGLPAPTDFDYAEVDGETYHFVVTQTGQVFITNVHEVADPEAVEEPDEEVEDDPEEVEEVEDDPEEPEEAEDGPEEVDPNDVDEDDDEFPEGEDDDAADVDEDEEAIDDADEEEAPDEEVEDDEPEEFVFNGVIPAWFGMEPEEIDGEENPTLELTAGETYQFTWENGDGEPHNVVILDGAGEILERTEIISEPGETQTLEFEATEEMDSYVCEVHPDTMVGSILVEDPDPEPDPEPEVNDEVLTPEDMELFLDIQDRIVPLGIGELGGYDERGLLGIAFHPEFAENGRFFVRYSAPERHGLGYNHTDVLAEFQVGEDMTADPDTERTIMEVPQPQDNHNGGRLAFGPDGYLYTSLGDGGNVHDIGVGHVDDWYDENEGGNAQDTQENLHGGIHRIDVDVEEDQEFGEYGIPDDNPLVGLDDHLEEYWAWGFRNPWGMSIDDDGQVFVADAGQHFIESVYAVEEGGNYSWNVKEGSFCFSPDSPLDPPEDCPDEVGEDAGEGREGELLRDPIAEYQHMRVSEAFIDSSVVVGGHRYQGEAIPELEDAYVFANWSSEGVAQPDGEILTALDPGVDEPAEEDVDPDDEEDEPEDAIEVEDDENDENDELTEDDVDDDDEIDEEDVENDDLVGVEQRWPLEELQFEGAEDESINRYVYTVERDEEGELYVLANTDFRPDPATGEIYKIVPADEGAEVPAPEDPFVVDEEMMEEEEEDPEDVDPDDVEEEDVEEDDEEFPEGEHDEDDEMAEDEMDAETADD